MIRPHVFLGAAACSLALALVLGGGCSKGAESSSTPAPPPGWVTSAGCVSCHPEETEAWRGSHHDLAMQEATDETVLGDFEDASFESHGVTTRFRRDGERFLVETPGPDGERAELEVAYVFGVEPLQQVLLRQPGGRLQGFTIAWDADEERWFDLYPDESYPPSSELHWSGRYQNWNGMCAECHSTGLRKGYDPGTDTFETTWEELDVACEACHGPGGGHVAWAEADAAGADTSGFVDRGLTVPLRRGEQQAQMNACSPCHARRTALTEAPLPGADWYDHYAPELLRPGSYFADGQIDGEVYVWGSFTQSKMHAAGVTCTDCHDPHSLELLAPDNGVCLQCHSPFAPVERFPTLAEKEYDTPEHHFHEPGTEGARCVSCHMPERTYMVIDERRDHSFRIPRPHLSAALGTPDACSACHEEGPVWAAERIAEQYGEERASQGYHWSVAIAGGRAGDPAALEPLVVLARDREAPAIARATAVELLRPYGEVGEGVGGELADDPEPLVRQAALNALSDAGTEAKLGRLAPKLDDPVRVVRIEAARQLVDVTKQLASYPREALAPLIDLDRFDEVLEEWIAAQEVSAELPWSHFNLATMLQDRGDSNEAAAEYRRALELDPEFLPARANLATLYNGIGRNLEAERILREGLELTPDEGELHYSLGLLLAEVDRVPDAADALVRAWELMPGRPRVAFNAGLALQQAGRVGDAERVLLEAERRAPDDIDLLHALTTLYESEGDLTLALSYAERLRAVAPPEAEFATELLERIRSAASAD